VPNFSWTGCYVGIVGGGAWGDSEHIARSGSNVGTTITGNFRLGNGGIAGGTFGCDYQVDHTVMGLENDASWMNLQGATPDLRPFNVQATSSTHQTWMDTLRGRVGYAFDHFLVYGTAGAAFAGTNVTVTNPAGTVSDSRPRIGLAMGIGSEWAAWTGSWGAVSFRLEYLHTDFGSKQYVNPPVTVGGFTVLTRDVKLTDDIVRASVNVRFNWGDTVIAK
jgi:outer membrane immunogenic protein